MSTTLFICVILGGIILGIILGKVFFGNTSKLSEKLTEEISKRFNYRSCAENINLDMSKQIETLQSEKLELNEELRFMMMWFIRLWTELYYVHKISHKDYEITTFDAFKALEKYTLVSLSHYRAVWKGEPCNKQCELLYKFLESINFIVNDTLNSPDYSTYFRRDDNEAFERFFPRIENDTRGELKSEIKEMRYTVPSSLSNPKEWKTT